MSYSSVRAADLSGRPNDRAAGCTITLAWNSILEVFAGVISGDNGTRLQVYEVAFNTAWINVSPVQSVVPGGESGTVALQFEPSLSAACRISRKSATS